MERIIILFCIGLIIFPVVADRLPGEMDENQVFSIDTVMDIIGQVDDQSRIDWILSSNGSIPEGKITKQVVAVVNYQDSILTNGGNLIENKNFGFDSQNQGKSAYNVENEKVITYSSVNGSHLNGEETSLLDIAGYASSSTSTAIRCVFGETEKTMKPAFCNVVKSSSSLINLNSGQISSQSQIRAIASSSSTPAGLNFQIAVSPDTASGDIDANGTVKTEFAGHILEGREKSRKTSNKVAADNVWSDETEVTGGITSLQKSFSYLSGLKL